MARRKTKKRPNPWVPGEPHHFIPPSGPGVGDATLRAADAEAIPLWEPEAEYVDRRYLRMPREWEEAADREVRRITGHKGRMPKIWWHEYWEEGYSPREASVRHLLGIARGQLAGDVPEYSEHTRKWRGPDLPYARAGTPLGEHRREAGLRVRDNAGFARVRRMMLGLVPSVRQIGIFTAQNPQATKLPPKWNKAINKKLMAWLRERGYGPIKIGGRFGHDEDSFLVPNITRKDTVEAGKVFNQESVIWGRRVHQRPSSFRRGEPGSSEPMMVWYYIEGNKTAQIREVSLSGQGVQGRDDYYSEVKGRKFVIPFFEEEYEVRRRIATRRKRARA